MFTDHMEKHNENKQDNSKNENENNEIFHNEHKRKTTHTKL